MTFKKKRVDLNNIRSSSAIIQQMIQQGDNTFRFFHGIYVSLNVTSEKVLKGKTF